MTREELILTIPKEIFVEVWKEKGGNFDFIVEGLKVISKKAEEGLDSIKK